MIIGRWLLSSLTLLITAYLVPGFEIANFYTALIAALIIGIANAVIRPILIILTLPINILTLGLFTLIINAFILWFASTIVKGFDITTFSAALIAAIILWFIGIITNSLLDKS